MLYNSCFPVFFNFSWLNPLFKVGFERKLEEDDMYKVLPEDASDKLGEELHWYELQTCKNKSIFQ